MGERRGDEEQSEVMDEREWGLYTLCLLYIMFLFTICFLSAPTTTEVSSALKAIIYAIETTHNGLVYEYSAHSPLIDYWCRLF